MNAIKTFGADLKYAFHVITHPIDGFWDLKHEKRGKVYIAILFLILYVVTDILNKQFNGYTFNTFRVFPQNIDVIGTFVKFALIVIIWVLSNWGLTTLFDGEGSMRDILLYTGYAFLPLVLAQILLLPLTNILTTNESTIISLVTFIGFGWTGVLVYLGTMVTHQYSGLKTFLTLLVILLGMAVIVFLGVMFFFLIQEIFNFVYSIYRELELRR